MLKQRGSWQSTGKSPNDLSQSYELLFAHEAEEMIDSLTSTGVEEDLARRMVSDTFQVMKECDIH